MENKDKIEEIGKTVGDELRRQGMFTGDEDMLRLAEQFGMEIYDELPKTPLPKHIFEKVPYSFAKNHLLLPFDETDDAILIATCDPLSLQPLEEVRLMMGKDVVTVFCPKDQLLKAIHDAYNQDEGATSQLIKDLEGETDDSIREGELEVYDLLDRRKGQAPIVKLLNMILTEAIQQGASDIHFDPLEDGLSVRYRIDGVLQKRHSPASEYQTQLLTRIKVMSKMDIAERRLPQDGRIKLKMGPREIDFRVSTVPVTNGERIVLRILDKGNVILGLDKIGMMDQVFDEFKKLINLPEGIILVTGPTGSGKTTTLYSSICDLASYEINIMTIEDPVEYNLKGIAQIGVKPKIDLTFATGLRHILRQDPDVILIGEIRDLETAEIAIQSSLTGHLVMSTLHTNDAPSAITRLVDMGIEPYLLSSTIVGVMAQRLVRCICPHCKESYHPDAKELASLGIKIDDLSDGKLWKGKGCKYCYGSGYKGRHGIYELMSVGSKVQKQIVKSPDAVTLRKIALEGGMIPLIKHGGKLAAQGITTAKEVLRVTRGMEVE